MIDNFDPNTITEPYLRQCFLGLQSLVQLQTAEIHQYRNLVESLSAELHQFRNLVENQATTIKDLQQTVQQQRDEINRLKGEQGKPKIKPNNPKPPEGGNDLSSHKERHQPKPHHKGSKLHKIVVHREETCRFEKEQLPLDARSKGYETVVIQDIIFHPENVRFRREKYYSQGQNKTYLAPLPPGFEGEFGPGVNLGSAESSWFDNLVGSNFQSSD
jgi:hypothetical protein